jgi:hypothetical protein
LYAALACSCASFNCEATSSTRGHDLKSQRPGLDFFVISAPLKENVFSEYFDASVFQGGTPTTTTTPKPPTASPSWLNTGLSLLQTGFQGFLQLDENKTKRALADASVKISNDEVY